MRTTLLLLPLLLLGIISAGGQQYPDEVDSAFSDILSQIDDIGKSGGFGFGNNFGSLFPRVKTLGSKIERLVGQLVDASLGDEAQLLKQSFVDLGFLNNPYTNDDSSYFGSRRQPEQTQQLEKKVDDLDVLVARFEKTTGDFNRLNHDEKQKVRDGNRSALSLLRTQHNKLLKKCYYIRTRIEFLLNELYNQNANKNLTERMMIWKRFIENNEYVLSQQLSRSERELLYSFLAKKMRESEDDIVQSEELVFALV